jgi:hypothetical protein
MRRPAVRDIVQFFASYAHLDHIRADKFLKQWEQQADFVKRCRFKLFRGTGLLFGERWENEIRQALPHCQMGLILVSPAMLACKHLTKEQLATLLGDPAKPVHLALLEKVDAAAMAQKGLPKSQVFQLDDPAGPKAFIDCATPQARTAYMREFMKRVEAKLEAMSP